MSSSPLSFSWSAMAPEPPLRIVTLTNSLLARASLLLKVCVNATYSADTTERGMYKSMVSSQKSTIPWKYTSSLRTSTAQSNQGTQSWWDSTHPGIIFPKNLPPLCKKIWTITLQCLDSLWEKRRKSTRSLAIFLCPMATSKLTLRSLITTTSMTMYQLMAAIT